MKTYITIIIFSTITLAKAQNLTLDTIYANEHKNVALFFPDPIRQGITGAPNFVFTYNKEKEQHFGLLQAQPGIESNLLVVNKTGAIFSYIVKYKKQLKKLNYFIPKSASIGNEIPEKIVPNAKDTLSSKNLNETLYYKRFCTYLLKNKAKRTKLSKRKSGIVLKVENVVFEKEALYFIIEIKNKSTLDYDINFLNFLVDIRKKGRKKSLQRLPIKPLHKHLFPKRLKGEHKTKMVVVLPKFSLSRDRVVLLRLNEEKGERNIELKIPAKYINNPN